MEIGRDNLGQNLGLVVPFLLVYVNNYRQIIGRAMTLPTIPESKPVNYHLISLIRDFQI